MAARYAGKGDQTLTTSDTTALTVGSNATTAQRNQIYEFGLSVNTPSDSAIIFNIQLVSALGTSTAVTPGKIDPGDRAAQAAVGSNHTIEPTLVSNGEAMQDFFLNARATYRWVAPPGGALVHAATAGAGWAFQARHASRTDDVAVTAMWEE